MLSDQWLELAPAPFPAPGLAALSLLCCYWLWRICASAPHTLDPSRIYCILVLEFVMWSAKKLHVVIIVQVSLSLNFLYTLPWKLEPCTALCELHTASLLKLSVFNSELSVQQLHLSVTFSCTWWPSPSTLQIIMSELKVIRDPCQCLTAPNTHTSSRTVTATSVK